MKKDIILSHKFVEYIPETLEERTVYVSVTYATAVHKCCCGCGHEVVTPLSPADWTLSFDGRSISLDPSIGNWSFPCQSHYWIVRNKVRWAAKWSKSQIDAGRADDRLSKGEFYRKTSQALPPENTRPNTSESFWAKLKKTIF